MSFIRLVKFFSLQVTRTMHVGRHLFELIGLPEENSVLNKCYILEGFQSTEEESFSRVEIDMTLEEVINAELKSRLKGIMAYANVGSAVSRWIIRN